MVIMIKYPVDELKRRGIDGVCRVCVYDGSMGYSTQSVVIDWASKAVANSICRHMNKQVPDEIDVWYYVDSRDEPDLSSWR